MSSSNQSSSEPLPAGEPLNLETLKHVFAYPNDSHLAQLASCGLTLLREVERLRSALASRSPETDAPTIDHINALLSELADGRPLCDPTMDDMPCPSCASIFSEFYKLASRSSALTEGSCLWTLEDEDSTDYRAACCGRIWMFNVGDPAENHVTFCLYCGHPIALSVPSPSPEPDPQP